MIECIIWCPHCKTDLFSVEREPVEEGHYANKLKRLGDQDDTKVCGDCGRQLERR